jgi:hypothetical protein
VDRAVVPAGAVEGAGEEGARARDHLLVHPAGTIGPAPEDAPSGSRGGLSSPVGSGYLWSCTSLSTR